MLLTAVAVAVAAAITGVTPAASQTTASAAVAVTGSPAVARLDSHSEMIVTRLNDGRIVYDIGSLALEFSGWADIPGNGRTPFDPAVKFYPGSGKIVVAVVGSGGDGIWLQSYDRNSKIWEKNWTRIPTGGTFMAAPALAVKHWPGLPASRDDLYVYGVTGDGRVWEQTWSEHFGFWRADWSQVPGSLKTHVAVAAEWVKQDGTLPRLHLVLKGDNQRLYYITKTYDQWAPTWKEIPGGGLTNHAPHMAPHPGVSTATGSIGSAALVVRGLDGKVVYQTLLKNSWNAGWKHLTHACCTPVGPAIDYTFFSTLYTVGSDGAIWGQNLIPNMRDLQPGSLAGWKKVPGSEPYEPGPTNPDPPMTPKADLALEGKPTYDESTKKLTVKFKNYGNANASSFIMQITINGYVVVQQPYASMTAGQGDTVVFDATNLAPGRYNFATNLDVYDTVVESNDSNNEFHSYFDR
jgi:hypothetical protein